MKQLQYTTPTEAQTTTIHNKENFFLSDEFLECIASFSKNVMIVTDTTVYKIFGNTLFTKLKARFSKVHIYVFPPGESSKIRKTKEEIENTLLKNNYLKDSLIIALGGGITTDLAGFVASTYMRSIPYASIPTTLLCSVDACLGGKTAVNTEYGKNQIGCFHQPKAFFIDPNVICSNSLIEMRNGLAEIIKYGLITNSHLFNLIESSKNLWDLKDIEFLKDLINMSLQEKISVIEKDPKEQNLRKILNFGHTIGHALEKSCDFSLSHGEAISIGMVTESYFSYQLGYLSYESFKRIYNLFKAYGFPLKLPSNLNKENVLLSAKMDKKNNACGIGIVILSEIGSVQMFEDRFISFFSDHQVEDLLEWMFQEFKPQEKLCKK